MLKSLLENRLVRVLENSTYRLKHNKWQEMKMSSKMPLSILIYGPPVNGCQSHVPCDMRN